jgi:hypothetical protein
MSVAFKELAGSPVEQYGEEGFIARREFLIAWEDRDAFAAEVLGTASQYGGGTAIAYPGKSSVRAVGLRYEPLDPDNPDSQQLVDLAGGLNSYSRSFAKARVEYRTIGVDRRDLPDVPQGTFLTYRMRFSAEHQPMPSRGWSWEDSPAVPPPDDLNLAMTIPITEHHVTWHQVINPPWAAIRELQGKVNEGAFMGAAEGTVLLEGADADKRFHTGFDLENPEFFWRIHYVFRERAIKHAGGVYGWNHHFREKPPGWAAIVQNGNRMYELADFAPLFQFAALA